MNAIVELTRRIEELAIELGNTEGLIEREYLRNQLCLTRQELEHEIRKSERG